MAEITVAYGTSDERVLTEVERGAVWNALIVARERYIEDAKDCRKAAKESEADGNPGAAVAYNRLAAQFEKQATDAQALVETFD